MKKYIIFFFIISPFFFINCAEVLENMAIELNKVIAQDNLSNAASIGDLYGVQNALANGALVNGRDSKGFTPLTRAAAYGHLNVVDLLVKSGANPYLMSQNGVNPISAAQNNNQFHILTYFVSGNNLTSQNSSTNPNYIYQSNNSNLTTSNNLNRDEHKKNNQKTQNSTQNKIRIKQLKNQVKILESKIKTEKQRLEYWKKNWESNPSSSSAIGAYRSQENLVTQLENQKLAYELEIARLEAKSY